MMPTNVIPRVLGWDLKIESRPARTQELVELPGGEVRLRLRLNSLEEAERWVLSWGLHATVVRPKRLATRLCGVAEGLAGRYGAEGMRVKRKAKG